MKTYLDLLNHVLTSGVEKSDRTGTGTQRLLQMRFDLRRSFPLLTTKKLHTVRSLLSCCGSFRTDQHQMVARAR